MNPTLRRRSREILTTRRIRRWFRVERPRLGPRGLVRISDREIREGRP